MVLMAVNLKTFKFAPTIAKLEAANRFFWYHTHEL